MKFDSKKLLNKITGQEKADPDKVHDRFLRSGRFSLNVRYIVFALIALVAVIAVVSAAVFFSERGGDDEDTTAQSGGTVDFAVAPDALNTNFLLALSGTSDAGLDFLGVMSVDSEGAKVSIRPIDKTEIAIVDGIDNTLEEHFNSGGVNGLQSALINCEQLAVARYIVCSEENFTQFLSRIDPMTLTVPETISYDFGGINLTIEAGTREFTPDELMKYFCFLSEDPSANREQLETIFREISRNFFDPEDEEKLTELFSETVNCFNTNISAADVQNYYKTFNALAQNGGIDDLAFGQ